MVRRAAKGMAFLVCVDGLASYVTAFVRVFRDPVRTGRRGRPRLAAIPGLLLGQVIKHHSGRRLVDVTRRVVLGTVEAIAGVLSATATGTGINTSYIERLNATSRGAMCPLVRRGRAIARGERVLTGWMYLVDVPTTSAGGTTACGSPPGRVAASSGASGPRRWRRA